MTKVTEGLEAKVKELALKRKAEIESGSVKIIYYNNVNEFLSTKGNDGK